MTFLKFRLEFHIDSIFSTIIYIYQTFPLFIYIFLETRLPSYHFSFKFRLVSACSYERSYSVMHSSQKHRLYRQLAIGHFSLTNFNIWLTKIHFGWPKLLYIFNGTAINNVPPTRLLLARNGTSDWPHTFLHPKCFCLAYN